MCDFFFSRFGLTEEHRADCHDLLRAIFPTHKLTTHEYQGYCSYTVLLSYPGIAQERGSSLNALQSPQNLKLEVNREAFQQPQHPDDFWNQCLIVQFRPPVFALDIQTTNLATAIYGAYAPSVRQIGHVHLYSHPQAQNRDCHDDEKEEQQQHRHLAQKLSITAQPRLPGLPYSAIQIQRRHLSPAQLARQKTLVCDFAAFLARGWPTSTSPTPSNTRTSPCLPLRPGPLHAATPRKLALLAKHLPTAALRAVARRTLHLLPLLRCLPLCLNHGDVVPGNMVVGGGEAEARLLGLVDWAEAEVGPWGVPLYGVEFLLGWVGRRVEGEEEQGGPGGGEETAAVAAWAAQTHPSSPYSNTKSKWHYTPYAASRALRSLFDATLFSLLLPPLSAEQRRAVRVARDVGVLLWFGFAWDEGDVGRVVGRGTRDEREVVLLEAFLGASEGMGESGRGRL